MNTFYHLTCWVNGEQRASCHSSYVEALKSLKTVYPEAVKEENLSGYTDMYIRTSTANDSLPVADIRSVRHVSRMCCDGLHRQLLSA